MKVLQLRYLISAIVILLLTDCATTPRMATQGSTAPILNSERIKQKFGSYGVEVIATTVPGLRVSNLFSLKDEIKITRTFAVTRFEEQRDPSLDEGHRRIVEENQSIGATFKELGFTILKENLFIGDFEPKTTCIFEMMGAVKPQPLATYIYRLSLSKGDIKNVPYAVIAELQHPDYLSTNDLSVIYGTKQTPENLEDIWVSVYAALGNLRCN